MTRFSIEVRNGTTRFHVALQAESVERALELADGIYPSSEAVRGKFPRAPEGSLARTAPPQRLAA